MKKFIAKWSLGDIVAKHYTDVPFNKIMQIIPDVVKKNGFSVLITHNFKETYEKKGLQLNEKFEYSSVQICNAEKSFKALNMSKDMGVMMPKSIIISQENGKTALRFMKLKPWVIGMMFPEINILPMSKKISQIMEKIVKGTIKEAELQNSIS